MFFLLCKSTINRAKLRSCRLSGSSQITKNKSNLDMIGGEMLMLYLSAFDLSYLPKIGFAAAKILVLALRVACTPALAIEMVCCSMASWMATTSLMSILSN